MSNKKQRPIWFKAKWFGWGWYPATVQGALILAIYVVAVVAIVTLGESAAWNNLDRLFYIVIPFIGVTSLLTAIGYSYGEKPAWRWGKPKSKSKQQ